MEEYPNGVNHHDLIQRSIGWEGAQFERIERLVEFLVAEVKESGLWRVGDGYGGWILNMVRDKAVEVGLEAKPAPQKAKHPRTPIHVDVRARVFARDGLECVGCGTGDDLAVDHIVAVANGGTNDIDNLQTLCRPCNSRKGSR